MSDIKRLEVGPRMSQAVIHGGLVYLAGQVGNPGDTVSNQTQTILERIDALLEQAGSNKSRILQTTIWMDDMKDFAEMNKVWDAWVDPANPPARATGEANWQPRNTRSRSSSSRHSPKARLAGSKSGTPVSPTGVIPAKRSANRDRGARSHLLRPLKREAPAHRSRISAPLRPGRRTEGCLQKNPPLKSVGRVNLNDAKGCALKREKACRLNSKDRDTLYLLTLTSYFEIAGSFGNKRARTICVGDLMRQQQGELGEVKLPLSGSDGIELFGQGLVNGFQIGGRHAFPPATASSRAWRIASVEAVCQRAAMCMSGRTR